MTSAAYNQHVCHVRRLYRQALRTSRDWAFQHHLSRWMAVDIRKEFEANRHETNPMKIKRLLSEAQKELEYWQHPDPYKYPTDIGGSKWERNLPIPYDVIKKGESNYEADTIEYEPIHKAKAA